MARFLSSRLFLSSFLTRSTATTSLSEQLRPIQTAEQQRTPPSPPTHHLLIPSRTTDLPEIFNIELMDPDLWRLSYGIAQAQSAGSDPSPPPPPPPIETNDEELSDFDQIESLRLHKKLFYKLDRGSKEFQENDVTFYLRKTSKKKAKEKLNKANSKNSKKPVPKQVKTSADDSKKKGKSSNKETVKLPATESLVECKKARTPTFNQLTDPYHLPFCLDIFITKGSVRACVVHRVTSKVVAVAHSISKDMKFDLSSRRDPAACAAVGRVLAQRAIEDDIHNLVYTPRKGDNIEGKLQIVLQSIIDHGVDVKVKLKQRKPVKVASGPDYPMCSTVARESMMLIQ